MCFYNDSEWSASIHNESILTADEPIKCHECGKQIQPHETYRHLYQQEHEECERCCFDECECPKVKGSCRKCCCRSPDVGEKFEYSRCMECDKFLVAVAAAEIAAGCHEEESQPAYTTMIAEISQHDESDAAHYFAKAREMFPDIEAHLVNLWHRMGFNRKAKQ